jgi:hypothetical protein
LGHREVGMKRQANPELSSSGSFALAQYEHVLCEREDLAPASIRNYLSDVCHFMAWYEHQMDTESYIFTPQVIITSYPLSCIPPNDSTATASLCEPLFDQLKALFRLGTPASDHSL